MGGRIFAWVFAKKLPWGMGRFLGAVLLENIIEDSWGANWQRTMEWNQQTVQRKKTKRKFKNFINIGHLEPQSVERLLGRTKKLAK